MTLPEWNQGYPPRARLQGEVEAMAEAYLGAIQEVLPGVLIGAYLKGSAVKPWDTPLDYVPEVSDVDLHLRFRESGAAELDRIEVGLAVQAEAERLYGEAVPAPLHLPRPNVLNLDWLEQLPLSRYVSSPLTTVRVLMGDPPPGFPDDHAKVVALDREALLKVQGSDLSGLALDTPGRHQFLAIWDVSFRMSPMPSRVASVLSGDSERAWGANRSTLLRWLVELGEGELAAALVRYYLACWRVFLSGRRDYEAGRKVLLEAAAILRLGVEVGQR